MGPAVGDNDGVALGDALGLLVGPEEGAALGVLDGETDGAEVGFGRTIAKCWATKGKNLILKLEKI